MKHLQVTLSDVEGNVLEHYSYTRFLKEVIEENQKEPYAGIHQLEIWALDVMADQVAEDLYELAQL